MALTNSLAIGGVGIDLYGTCKKYTINLADIVALGAFTTGTINLDTLPAGAVVQAWRIKHSQAVAGPSISAATAQVVTPNNSFGAAFDVFQAVSTTALQTGSNAATITPAENFAATTNLQLALTSTGANLSVATAGKINVWVKYTVLA